MPTTYRYIGHLQIQVRTCFKHTHNRSLIHVLLVLHSRPLSSDMLLPSIQADAPSSVASHSTSTSTSIDATSLAHKLHQALVHGNEAIPLASINHLTSTDWSQLFSTNDMQALTCSHVHKLLQATGTMTRCSFNPTIIVTIMKLIQHHR
jgi:hypothetical protein